MTSDAPPSPPRAPDEARLVARAREHDPEAFEQLIVAHAAPLQRMLRRVLGSQMDAEEVLQETFLKAWRGIERFRGEARFSTWLYRIALNEARRRQTYDAHRRAVPIDDVLLELPDLSAGPAMLAESAELEAFLEQCVAELPATIASPSSCVTSRGFRTKRPPQCSSSTCATSRAASTAAGWRSGAA